MLLRRTPPLHLTYCLNVHPGETWPENLAAIRRYALAVRRQIAPGRPFGLGLRLSHQAAQALSKPAVLARFRAFLAEHDLYVFTINGFPYGRFHGRAIKANVYRPDWRSVARRNYTNRLSDLLAALLPEGVDGSISTVPISYGPGCRRPTDLAAAAANLAHCVAHLHQLALRTGREVHLGLEPEPDCVLQTTGDLLAFFETTLPAVALPHLERRLGCRRERAEEILRRHLGVCLDTCHLAVQHETLRASVRRLRTRGVRISKVQLSAALRAPATPAALARLATFRDPVYLHQVRSRRPGHPDCAYPDLDVALVHAPAAADPPPEWRVHFHVPLYFAGDGELATTAAALTPEFFTALLRAGVSHLEIETYTFHVMPPSVRPANLVASIVREYAWVLPRLETALRGTP